MFWLPPGLAALALIPVPFVVVVATRYGQRSRPALQEVQQRIGEVTAEVEENISGVRVVKAFAAEPRQLDRFRAAVGARLRPVDDRDPPAGVLQPVPRVPAQPRAGRDPAGRRPPGRQRHADAGRLHRVLHVPADADRADADARRRARHGAARDRLGRAAAGDPRPRAGDRPGGAGAARGPRARRAARRHVRLRRRRRTRCTTSTWSSRPARRSRSSAPPARARRRSCSCCRGCTTRARAAC